VQKAARWPCGVCGRGSIQCTSCDKWLHKKCSGIKGSMYKVMRSFICRVCWNPVISTGHTSVDIGASANLEVVDKCKYDLVVYDNLYIINKHFSKKNRNFIFRNSYEH